MPLSIQYFCTYIVHTIVQRVQNAQFYFYARSLFAGSGSETIIPDPCGSGSTTLNLYLTFFSRNSDPQIRIRITGHKLHVVPTVGSNKLMTIFLWRNFIVHKFLACFYEVNVFKRKIMHSHTLLMWHYFSMFLFKMFFKEWIEKKKNIF